MFPETLVTLISTFEKSCWAKAAVAIIKIAMIAHALINGRASICLNISPPEP
jgi:hypothetical protein